MPASVFCLIFCFTLIAFGEEKMLIHFDADILKQTMQEINNLKSKSANIMLIKIWFLFQYSEKLILNTLKSYLIAFHFAFSAAFFFLRCKSSTFEDSEHFNRISAL